jgi:hypothetical protein
LQASDSDDEAMKENQVDKVTPEEEVEIDTKAERIKEVER